MPYLTIPDDSGVPRHIRYSLSPNLYPSPHLFSQEYHSRAVIFAFTQEYHSKAFSSRVLRDARCPQTTRSEGLIVLRPDCPGRMARCEPRFLQECDSMQVILSFAQEYHSSQVSAASFGRSLRGLRLPRPSPRAASRKCTKISDFRTGESRSPKGIGSRTGGVSPGSGVAARQFCGRVICNVIPNVNASQYGYGVDKTGAVEKLGG